MNGAGTTVLAGGTVGSPLKFTDTVESITRNLTVDEWWTNGDLRDLALSVSGSAHKSFTVGGRTYSHIMDPRTGRPVEGILGVAVLSRSATAGDALDNALFVEGIEAARRHLRRLPDTRAFFLLPDGPDGFQVVRLGE